MSLRRQLDRATQFAVELSQGAVDEEAYSAGAYINQSSSHRVKKRQVSMMRDPKDLSSSSDDSSEKSSSKKVRKRYRQRTSRSKNFLDSLRMAKRAKVSLERIHDISRHKKVFEVKHDGNLRLVEISETIDCNCTFAAKRDLCLHAVWVLINVPNVNEDDDTLQQKVHDNKTLDNLFKQMRSHTSIPSATTVGSPQVAQGNQAPVKSSPGSMYHVAQVHQPPVQSSAPSMQHVAQVHQPPVQSSAPSMLHVAQVHQPPVQSSTPSMHHRDPSHLCSRAPLPCTMFHRDPSHPCSQALVPCSVLHRETSYPRCQAPISCSMLHKETSRRCHQALISCSMWYHHSLPGSLGTTVTPLLL